MRRLIDGSGVRVLLCGLATTVVVAGCQDTGVSQREFDLMHAWLTCEECQHGERDSVRTFGSRAVPLLFEAIVAYPADRRANVEAQAGLLFHDLGLALAADSVAFVNQATAAFDRLVRSRAVASLGDAGAFETLQQALDSATQLGWAPESLAIIEAGLLRDLSNSQVGNGIFVSWTVDQPTVGTELCNGEGAVPCTGSWTVPVRARATGPTGVVSPWSRVFFYLLSPTPTGGDAELLGTVGVPVATADAVNTSFDWTLDVGALGGVPGPARIVAVGVNASGVAFRTPDFDLITIVEGT